MEHERLYTHEEQIIYADLKDKKLTHETRLAFAKSAGSFIVIKIIWTTAVVLTAVGGAFLFKALEAPNELKTCQEKASLYESTEKTAAASLSNMSLSYLSYSDYDPVKFTSELDSAILTFRNNIILISYDGRNCSLMGTPEGVQYNWNFYGSLLFATTIMTTVGYGNFAPLTTWGRIVVIAYGLVTLPLMLAFLAMIGELMADVFRFVYLNVCCLISCRRWALRRAAQRRRALERENITAEGADGKHATWKGRYKDWAMDRGAHPWLVDDNEDNDEDDDIPIPITLILVSVFVYIAFGAILFANWGNWTVMDGAYFSFITISTVGFGDIIPGVPADGNWKADDEIKLLATSVYMILGMAFLSMAFQLIQDQLGIKFKKFSNNHVGEEAHAEDDNIMDAPE